MITRFTGSMRFVYLHLALFGFWIFANLGWVPGEPGLGPLFVVLAMLASVEAIFLSTFVLISQNSMAAGGQARRPRPSGQPARRARDHQAAHAGLTPSPNGMGIQTEVDPELDEITQDVAPEAVLDEIEGTEPHAKQH